MLVPKSNLGTSIVNESRKNRLLWISRPEKKFIENVSLKYVIFSSGHKHDHPRPIIDQRYIDSGVKVNKVFRTDLIDDEGKNK